MSGNGLVKEDSGGGVDGRRLHFACAPCSCYPQNKEIARGCQSQKSCKFKGFSVSIFDANMEIKG